MNTQLFRPVGHQTLCPRLLIFLAVLTLGFVISSGAMADDEHLGIIEYEVACLSCHGIEGRGDGPMAKSLRTAPADLTKISKANNGKFPVRRITEIIDGRAIVAAHGERAMPVWGNRYRQATQSEERSSEIELRARRQINALVRYLETMQQP
jgi:mono/diheme cytochrome c family protein